MYTAAVITVSDKGSQGLRVDTGGPLVAQMLKDAGYDVAYTAIVPDEQPLIEEELIRCADDLDIALVITTGGTGFSPRDVTPEATVAVCQRMAPGIPEAMRYESLKITNRAMLTRQQAGIRGSERSSSTCPAARRPSVRISRSASRPWTTASRCCAPNRATALRRRNKSAHSDKSSGRLIIAPTVTEELPVEM